MPVYHESTETPTPAKEISPLPSTIQEPLELCAMCLSGATYQYDFDRRCCRARHMLQLDKPRRAAHYARLLETEGREYVIQRMEDVKVLHLHCLGFPKAAGNDVDST